MLTSSSSLSFGRRGLPGLLLLVLGLALSVVFRKSSAWPVDTQHVVFPVALVLAVGGSVLVGSYARQRPLHTLKMELVSAGIMVGILLCGKLF